MPGDSPSISIFVAVWASYVALDLAGQVTASSAALPLGLVLAGSFVARRRRVPVGAVAAAPGAGR